MRLKKYLAIPFLSCFLVLSSLSLLMSNQIQAQGFYTTFGQNRVQYHDFIWSYYESPNFVTYYYQGGYDLCKFTVHHAEQSLEEIESILEFKNSSKVEIMIYQDVADLKQTNIGLGIEQNNTGGVTKILGNKIFVHFDGNHQNLARQIREGVARVSLEKMIFGTNIQEILQNAVLLNLPDWYVNGLVSYIGKEWDAEMDNRLRENVVKGAYSNFNRLSGEDATFAGHALWHYIAQVHGQSAIPNLLYLTRVNRSVESGFLFVLGNQLNATIREFNNYYVDLYNAELANKTVLSDSTLVKRTGRNYNTKNIVLDELKVSPDGRFIAYTTSEIGKNKVFVYDSETNKQKVILRTGFKSHSQPFKDNYPLLTWSHNSERLVVIYNRRDHVKIMMYNAIEDTKQTDDIVKFQQIIDIDFTDDNKRLIMSAVKRGQVDLYLFDIPNSKTKQLTNDYYDDLQPRFVKLKDRKGIVFTSNRLNNSLKEAKFDTILPLDNFDVFFYDLSREPAWGEERELVQITNTPLSSEVLPSQYDSLHIGFLSAENGIRNRYVAYFDSVFVRQDVKVFYPDSTILNPTYRLDSLQNAGAIDTIIYRDIYQTIAQAFPVSNCDQNILESDIAVASGEEIRLFYTKKNYEIHREKVLANPKEAIVRLDKTTYRKQLETFDKAKQDAPVFPVPIFKPNSDGTSSIKLNENNAVTKNKEGSSNTGKTTIKTKDKSLVDDFLGIEAEEEVTKIEREMEQTEGGETSPITNEEENETTGANSSSTEDATSTDKIDIEDYYFQSEFDFEDEEYAEIEANNKNLVSSTKDNERDKPLFVRTDIRKYFTQFSIDHVVSQFDNTLIFVPYENFNLSDPGGFGSPDLNAFFKFGITDLMENYRVIGGFRFPLGLNGTEYFLEYWNMKKRLDKKVLFYRKAERNLYLVDLPDFPDYPVTGKTTTHYAQYGLVWPFDANTSIRGYLGYRNDRLSFLATDRVSLALNDTYENWAHAKVELVFDNTLNIALNILNGTRYKIYLEMHKPFDAVITDQELDFSIKKTGLLGIFGGDFRHYQKVHRQIIWANRLATGLSFGSKKMIYYLGGVENWLAFDPNRRFDDSTPIDYSANYAFKSLATNLRGFKQNVRNGSSYMVLNSELRIPIFSYLSTNPLRSEFLKNFQVIGFADLGTAWQGLSPFDEKNQFDIVTIGQVPVEATVKYFRNPIVGGYGLGMRSKLLGYFLRLDAAWGIDSGAKTDTQWYLSMGLDF